MIIIWINDSTCYAGDHRQPMAHQSHDRISILLSPRQAAFLCRPYRMDGNKYRKGSYSVTGNNAGKNIDCNTVDSSRSNLQDSV